MKKIILLSLFLFSCLLTWADVNIIPKPVLAETKEGNFTIKADTKIQYPAKNEELKRLSELVVAAVKDQCGITLKTEGVKKPKASNAIYLSTADLSIDNEDAYVLNVTRQGITLTGKNPIGIFYGVQTLRQLFPLSSNAPTANVDAIHIEDYPRFWWRGMLLDVCRYMWSMDYIKKVIDEMSYYKLNKLHWHLTEDQGWRIEIKKYPKLMEVAAWRNGSQYGPNRQKDVDEVRYGGNYTQEQTKEIVD